MWRSYFQKPWSLSIKIIGYMQKKINIKNK